AALEPEAHEVHAGEPSRRQRLAREDGLVADRHAAVVDAVLESPQPVRLRADDGVGLASLRKLQVLAAHGRARDMTGRRKLDDALAPARWPVAVLREERDAGAGGRGEGDHRVAAHEAASRSSDVGVKRCAALVIREASRYSPAPMCPQEPLAGATS